MGLSALGVLQADGNVVKKQPRNTPCKPRYRVKLMGLSALGVLQADGNVFCLVQYDSDVYTDGIQI